MFKPYVYQDADGSWWAVYEQDFLFGAKEKQFSTKKQAEDFLNLKRFGKVDK